jgi:hypothetical protein
MKIMLSISKILICSLFVGALCMDGVQRLALVDKAEFQALGNLFYHPRIKFPHCSAG